ncbi:phage major capsid protein, P2 family [Sphingopyxis yananensis]|uniref:phage major capsid protein, P2 family n=1 Tax=Sphingopyxis yananensis TaxID=2886687 RepID=UPI001D129446|nr:phage major capsid protein, P2 family [Sphingopyxis yananensis]MCC2603008.1 phage major capsid protein, P2 family [Sphingopyxis yananensis]
MRKDTRAQLLGYSSQIAMINGVDDAAQKFTVTPTVRQKMQERIQQGSEFLSQISFETVIDKTGQKVGVGTTRPIASRTNTAGGNRRIATDPTSTSNEGIYVCAQTNFDTAIPYAKLDNWRHKPEFQTLLRDVILKQQARDMIMIGWNGTSVAATTDRVANPLLQDVNKGWLHHLRTDAPARCILDGALTTDPTKAIYVASGVEVLNAEGTNAATAKADYVNLDHLVHDLTEMLDEWHRDSSDLVVIVGRDLLQDKYSNILTAAANTPTEVEARDRILTLPKQVGGKRAVVVPFFPAKAVMITTLENLAIYEQEETRRRLFRDEPDYDQVANYESANLAYVIEDYGLAALAQNIVMGPKPA